MYIRTLTMAFQSLGISMFYALGACETSRWLVLRGRRKYAGLMGVEKRLLFILKGIIPFLLLIPLADEIFTFVIGYNSLSTFHGLPVLWDYIYMVGLFFLCSLVIIAL